MHLSIEPQASCARTWLGAATALNELAERSFHNVIMSVEQPTAEDENDRLVIEAVNRHLARNDKYQTSTVANTIFPEALYRAHGCPDFFKVYLERVCTRRSKKGWGRYFERLISHPSDLTLNPLQNLIEKLRREANRKGGVCNAYEMDATATAQEISIYDPVRDAKAIIGGQCLSFLSFHIGPDRRLLLTAVYRNHYYVARLLGNLIGLGRLLRFVAEQTELQPGELTAVSTHAEIDTVGSRDEINQLLNECRSIISGSEHHRSLGLEPSLSAIP